MPRRTSKSLVKATPPAVPMVRRIGDQNVVIEAEYRVPAVHPTGSGPWSGEADKIAWTDPMTGLGCIIRRSPHGQHLCGYVSVPPEHPLFGRHVDTMGEQLIGVHGGLDYSSACQHWEPEEISICHPSEGQTRRFVLGGGRQKVHINDEAAAGHDAWWFGFSCNQIDDITPTTRNSASHARLLDGVTERTYKTEAYVFRECVRLARQLRAIGSGRDPREADEEFRRNGYNPVRNEG